MMSMLQKSKSKYCLVLSLLLEIVLPYWQILKSVKMSQLICDLLSYLAEK